MNVPIIHVHSFSDKSTIGYVTFMWETMRSLATHPDAIKLTIHTIGPTASERLKDLPNATTRIVKIPDEKSSTGSSGHGHCIEQAISMTDDGDIHVLCDGDTAMVAKGWDDYVRVKLLDEGIGIIGTAAEDIGGFSSGNALVQLAKNIPTVAWCALSPLHSWRLLRARPAKEVNISIDTDELSKIYNLPRGYHVLRDVGWQIAQYIFDNKITYQAWKQLKASNTAVILKGLSDYHEEYHVDGHVPFVVHQRGSLRHAYRSDRISTNFYTATDEYLSRTKEAVALWCWEENEKNKDALANIVAFKEAYNSNTAAREADIAAQVEAEATPSFVDPHADTTPISGWLKATLDGTGPWSRYKIPVTKTVAITYAPDGTTKNLRLEGTVTEACITLPAAPVIAHTLTVRNLTAGPVVLREASNGKTVTMPVGACWLIVVDIDGVIHAQ